MSYQATRVAMDPLEYFLRDDEHEPLLRVSDVILRENKNPREVFSRMIRTATGSKWSHSALVYLTSDPYKGYNNTFLVEAKTKGIHLASWRNEVIPFDQFTVGVKRPRLDWYVENPYEHAHRDPKNPEDMHGISYLRHVRGIALDQITGLYDHKTVYELAALYAKRAARRHLPQVPQVADVADGFADLMKKWDEHDASRTSVLNFICSGLVQYSFFEALRRRIMNDMDIPEHREAALSNMSNMQQIIFRDDPDHVMEKYLQQLHDGTLDIHDPAPDDVLDLLKTATPADFNNDSKLEWLYVILKGVVWKIEPVADGYQPESEEEGQVLKLLEPEHFSVEESV